MKIDAPPKLTPGVLMAMITLDQLVIDRSLGLSAVAFWIVRQLHMSSALWSRCNAIHGQELPPAYGGAHIGSRAHHVDTFSTADRCSHGL